MSILHDESIRQSRLVKHLVKVEGLERKPYGKPLHIGIGHLLDLPQTKREIAIQGDATELTEDQIYDLLYEDINDALEDLISQMFQCGIGTQNGGIPKR